jgi:hypothetical protein
MDIVHQVAGQPLSKDVRIQDPELRRRNTSSIRVTIDGPAEQELRAYREVALGLAGEWREGRE